MLLARDFTKNPITSYIRGGRFENLNWSPKIGTTEGGNDQRSGNMGRFFFLLSEQQRTRQEPATTATAVGEAEGSEGRDGVKNEKQER